jgi:hypothetical protein
MQREKELRRVEKEMAAFNAAFPRPKRERIIKAVWKDFIWFNKKQNEAYCTRCGADFEPLRTFKHKKECECPVCGKKSEGRDFGRQKSVNAREDIHWLVVPHMNGDTFMTRRYRVCIWWNDFRNPIVDVTECFRDVHGDEWKGYMWWQANSSLYAWMDYREKRGMYYNSYTSTYYMPHSETIYHPERLNKMFAGTKYRYFPIAEMVEHFKDWAWTIDNMVVYAKTMPWLEMIWKVGFKKLVDQHLQTYKKLDVNTEATNVIDLLKVTHAQYKMLLRHGNPSIDDLEVLQETGVADYDDWRALCELDGWNAHKEVIKLTRYAKLKKILRYLANGVKLNDFIDYVGWGVEIGYDMTDEYYLFPVEFMAAHDKMLAEVRKHRDKQERKEKAKRNKIIKMLAKKNGKSEAFHLHSNGLFIRIAESEDELRNEGTTLHHCVATYAQRVMRGETMILFIRKEAEPDKPYYTMEFRDGHIIQLRGAHNCDPTVEVIKFREKFEKAIAKEARAA